MKYNKLFNCLLLLAFLFTSNCNVFRYTDARDIPVNAQDRVNKNLEEGRGIQFGKRKETGGVFDFASSNEMWRASIEVLDFVSFTNASYSGGIIITDWFSGNIEKDKTNLRELKITVRFYTNEIRSDGIDVIIHEKICSSSKKENCQIQKIKSKISNDIKLAILKKASIFKKESDKKIKKNTRKVDRKKGEGRKK